jgi:hypothetical protein
MRNKLIRVASLLTPALVGALAGGACSSTGDNPLANNPLSEGAEKLCGPCGTIATGDVGISGNAKLDGFFEAVGRISDATASINGDFDANIDALSVVYGVANFDASASIDTKVTALIAKIKGDISTNLMGGVKLDYQPAECHASLDVAVKAQADCEAKAGCTGDVTPPSATVDCKGSCTGTCMGSCDGAPPTCELTASAKCEGKCEGTCTLDAAASCDGTCHGTCSGTCSAKDANGQCNGSCDGMCQGSCEFKAAAQCSGTCSGKCEIMAGAMCDGGKPPSCSGSCTGQCSGSCTGDVTPPSAHVNCDASANCNAQASAKANATLECTPPSVQLTYSFAANVSASDQADFVAHLGELKTRGAAILTGFTKYDLLINGKTDASGKVLVQSPVASLTASVQGLVQNAGSIAAEVPVFRLGCATDAFGESASVLGKVLADGKTNLTAQGKFVSAFSTGFGS